MAKGEGEAREKGDGVRIDGRGVCYTSLTAHARSKKAGGTDCAQKDQSDLAALCKQEIPCQSNRISSFSIPIQLTRHFHSNTFC